ncbi:phage/plasmid primase, P4 family [Noviherbaspirillum sedimenti]|uniref:SF3 helicase domain-containing protein n=1 Tax=Noviherbaspirillum sedimenti TaxID=2320865 RepID=A0A3A3FVW5_9BURK|nr:phage/plasmid primase, P4 family [Noviherbaspirillum sedimenti]RJG00343.1 hypothetical protein D3878_01090 [Noviherbaspirillum sedimenti]
MTHQKESPRMAAGGGENFAATFDESHKPDTFRSSDKLQVITLDIRRAIADNNLFALNHTLRELTLSGADNIPAKLREFKAWVLWRATAINPSTGKFTKVPAYPGTKANRTGEQGSPKDLANLGAFDEVRAALVADPSFAGWGLAMLPQLGLVALDVDGCINDGAMPHDVGLITDNTYCEISPSGTGIRAFWTGEATNRKNANGELYAQKQFVTITGNRVDNTHCLFGEDSPATLDAPTRQELERRCASTTGKKSTSARLKEKAENDPYLQAIKRAGLYERAMSGGAHSIRCPFEEKHGDFGRPGGDGDTVYFQPHTNGEPEPRIFCQHTHGNDQDAYWQAIGFDNRAEGLIDADDDTAAQSDVKNARLLASALLKKRFVFEHGGRGWMQFKSGVYVICALGEAMEAAKGLGVDIIKNAPSDPEKFKRTMALAQRAMSAAGIKAALQLAESDPRIAVKPADFDTDPDLLNVLNGVVHLPTGELRPHDPAQFMSKQCPVIYDPAAAAPIWEKTIYSISNEDRDWVDFFQRAVGYSLSGYVNEEVMFFLLGVGANGKSLVCNVMRRVSGNYASVAPTNFLMTSKRDGESATPALASLQSVRIVQANEVEAGAQLSAQMAKVATSTDAISARHLYGRQFAFIPTHTLWVRGNHKPIITDNDEGIWRRVVLIPFDRHFSPEEKDVMLEEKIMREASGVLAWMVRGHLAYKQHGLRRARRVEAASLAYRAESDLVSQWIDERAIREAGATCAQADAYFNYRTWCVEQGLRPMAKKSLTSALIERGFSCGQESTGGRRRTYRGLKSAVSYGFEDEISNPFAQDAQD